VNGAIPVRICEVGPRDGLQNERDIVPVDAKVAFVDALSRCGFPEIEVTSFVSPKWVPQLADGAEVLARIRRAPGTLYSALVPNERGLDAALAAGVDKVAVFTAASESFCRRNLNASIAETLERLAPTVRRAREAGKPVRGYVSCVVRCPFEGPVASRQVAEVSRALLALGVDELDLGDTIGAAVPGDLAPLLEAHAPFAPPETLTIHLHDTRGTALACAFRAVELGVRSLDASCGGLGGCPFAPGAAGNLATEELVYAASGSGLATRIDLAALVAAAELVQASLGRPLPSRLLRAGVPAIAGSACDQTGPRGDSR